MVDRRIVIMGAAGRDFHNFNVVFRDQPDVRVVAFTVSDQIPGMPSRTFPAELAGPRYPRGIPILPEAELEAIIEREGVNEVVFAYSDVSHLHVMHQAARALAAGADFRLLGPGSTMIEAAVPVISVCAVRTGAGKSPATRFISDIVLGQELWPVVIRHPMPYGDLRRQRVERFAAWDDLERYGVTVEEREEFEPLLRRGLVVYAGVDYERVVREAEQEAPVIIWDGGNNDFPFLRPDLEIVIVDALRPGHEISYHPGEVNLRRADVMVITKVDSAPPDALAVVLGNVREANSRALVTEARLRITVQEGELIRGRRVLVIEDGPTLTHGGLAAGAGAEAATTYGAAAIVDPRPFAVGELVDIYLDYPHLGPILPAVGYSPAQLHDLEATITAAPADVIVLGTPVDLSRIIRIDKPVVRVGYDLEELGDPVLSTAVCSFLRERGLISEVCEAG